MRSQSGIAEVHILSKGALDEYIYGSALPAGAYRIAGAIAANKELSTEPYNPPKDLYNNVIRQNSKRNYKVLIESLQADLDAVNIADYISRVSEGADVLFIPEGYERYEGNASGVPTSGSGVWWLRNPNNGIWFFDYPNNNHMGLEWEFKVSDSLQSLMCTLEVALSSLKAKNIQLAAQTNVIKEAAVAIPDINSNKQYVLDLVALQYHDGTTYQHLAAEEDMNNFSLNLKSVGNKQTKSNRSIKHLGEIDLTVVISDASSAKIRSLWSIDQFAKIRATFNNPVNGLDYYLEISKNTITNDTNAMINKDRRDNTFKLAGQFPISLLTWDLGVNRTIKIGR